MRKLLSLVAAPLCALALSAPGFAAEPLNKGGFTGSSWLELRTYLAGEGNIAAPAQPVASLRAPSEKVRIIEMPLDPRAVEGPSLLSAALEAYQKALHPLREAVARNPNLSATLKENGLSPKDVLAVSKGEDGVTLFVDPAA